MCTLILNAMLRELETKQGCVKYKLQQNKRYPLQLRTTDLTLDIALSKFKKKIFNIKQYTVT